LDQFFHEVLDNREIAVATFASQNDELAKKLMRHRQHHNEQRIELRQRHTYRLHTGLVESVEINTFHLDILTNLKHNTSLLTAVVYPNLGFRL
jgi:phosphate:Na+ symporter